MNIQQIRDELEIAALLRTYARGVDSRDWALWRSVFTENAVVDYTSAPHGFAGGRDEVADWLAENFGVLPMSQHYITNIDAEIDGDSAKVCAMFYNPMQLPGVKGLSFCGGYYHHDLVRTESGWRSSRMVEENVWFFNNPFAPAEADS
ncbi:nuclear transport factor 2 family protein [Gordonia rhizosphera]|uniref:SnoaL-like domain-containing protein n=1 Tax=Gordonia rhizosphera NBRC 16068 TaxID=1108045 RepID=K6X1I7_9ACTN|nr:nuclear transport factor 2 family protein [Gordonia rhizosphera]GAB92669.1 hypothetical protein GORHZ_186_00390 [Gordonia rhizosphera NBRC 16068]